MKRAVVVMSAVFMLVGTRIAGAQDAVATGKETGGQVVKKQTICAVMAGPVNKNLFVDYEGKRVYVCCKGCLGQVRSDPAAFVSKLEKEGITLDKTPAAGDATK